MTHQLQLEKEKYRQWVKAGLGLGYLKEGLAPFCNDIADQQHKDILQTIRSTKSIPSTVTCCSCQVETLKPDHKPVPGNAGNKVCPLGQVKCICCFKGKIACPSNICGAIYDYIVQHHASSPPAPNWKISDAQQWVTDPWSICKCFINAQGYEQTQSAGECDCTGLLHLMINNQYFHSHVGCNVTGTNNLFSKVRQYRNSIFHSSSMELEESEANTYLDDMIAVLQDGKELLQRSDAQIAVKKLQDLKKKDFIMTTEGFEEILRQIRDEMAKVLKSTENAATKEEYDDLKKKLIDLEAKMSDKEEGRLENEKELAELKKTITDLESQMCKEKKEKLEMEIEQVKLKNKLTVLDTLVKEQKEEMAKLKTETSSGQSQADYEQTKLEWQKEMIASYCKNLLKVPAMPLLPRGQKCNFSEIYVRPTITREIKGEKGETKEIKIKSMSDIFIKNGVPLKHIYVLGDAGSGKSSFCKYLVNCWCKAHNDEQNVKDEFDEVKEMKKFDFMFYISLRYNQDIDSVQDMIKNQYDIDISSPNHKKESAKIIILLDGLDEWSSERKSYNQFQTMGLPKQDVNKDYTIITTSRPWKVHTLGISETEIEQLLNLKEFDLRCEWEMVGRTVSQLNSIRHASKLAWVCKQKLKEKSLKSLKQVPIMLQQLICLWFDGKLDKTSRCAIYTGMLELFFTWNDMKTTRTSTRLMKGAQKVDLPKYLANRNILRLNSHFIYEVSQLAYETLFNCPKDKSLIFDICMFDDLEISAEVRENGLKLGIITEDECQNFSVSEPPSSLFSFIHKSIQEFLAAVNIGINFNAKICSSDCTGNDELAKNFINEVFQKCSTVNDILEQSNVVIMLCGLESRLAQHVSKYIYDTVSKDYRIQEYRRTINTNIYIPIDCIIDIQKLFFESMKELNASCSIGSNPVFYIGDLVIHDRENLDIVCSSIDQKQIVPYSVLSVNVISINTENVKFTKYLPMFHHLEIIAIRYGIDSQRLSSIQNDSTQSGKQRINEISNCVCETIKVNTSTLKYLSLDDVFYTDRYYPDFRNLPSMIKLVAIRMTYFTMSHDDTTTFCNFLERTSHLEQIHLSYVNCKCRNQHDVNLSKHQQLQYLHLYGTVSVIDVDTTNLEIFEFDKLRDINYENFFYIITKSNRLKELKLTGDYCNKSQLYHTNITERLVTVLPLLHNLSELNLYECKLTDNIIQLPLEMKSLNNINLHCVIMSLTTWQKFVDSLPQIPHTVDVSVWRCHITGDGEAFNDFRSTLIHGGGEIKDAKQYVKDQDQLVHVKRDGNDFFDFSTKK
ncbi:uncharacterized protein LOC132738723 [Ruditapes philippinarum]|uniref:uncharacterized protein LOC132738723 n=1 Tax=Ruditapes philippinarum TaxID=129788 RepID=UPI00295BF511|nr:uncharacterized protein LOC132738723 [Ruditapes philippinarum]